MSTILLSEIILYFAQICILNFSKCTFLNYYNKNYVQLTNSFLLNGACEKPYFMVCFMAKTL